MANNVNELPDYYNISSIKNQNGVTIDDQITYVTVELEKFNLSETDIQSDLEKLIFTMKNFTQYAVTTHFPQFWNEEWLQIAINELDTRNFSPEQRVRYETILAQNAVAVYNEKKAIAEAVANSKKEAIINWLILKVDAETIAKAQNVEIDSVLKIKNELEK